MIIVQLWNPYANDINLYMIDVANNSNVITNVSDERTSSNYIVDVDPELQIPMNLKASDNKLKVIENNIAAIKKLLTITLIVVTLHLWIWMSKYL